MVGYFVNPVAMRAELAGDPCLADLVDRSRDSALAAFEHADFPSHCSPRGSSPSATPPARPSSR